MWRVLCIQATPTNLAAIATRQLFRGWRNQYSHISSLGGILLVAPVSNCFILLPHSPALQPIGTVDKPERGRAHRIQACVAYEYWEPPE